MDEAPIKQKRKSSDRSNSFSGDVLPLDFEAGLVIPNIRSTERMGAIKELVDRLHLIGFVANSLPFLQSVLDREHLESTVMATGIAFPHARCRSVSKLGLAFGLSRHGVAFGSERFPAPVNIIALMAVPVIGDSPYIPVLAKLASLFQDTDFRPGLMRCGTPEEICGYLSRRLNEKIANELTPTPDGGRQVLPSYSP